jgi:hypothetical protein
VHDDAARTRASPGGECDVLVDNGDGLHAGVFDRSLDVDTPEPSIGEHVVEGVHHLRLRHHRQCRQIPWNNSFEIYPRESASVERRFLRRGSKQIAETAPLGPRDLVAVPPQAGKVLAHVTVYMLAFIRDVDNPFEYRGGLPGPADVDLNVLERCEARLRSLAVTTRSA